MPDCFEYLRKTILPQMPYQSNILLEKPSKQNIQANTENKYNPLVTNNAKINTKTNAAVENVFKHKKAHNSMLNQLIIDCIKRTYQANAGLKWHFLENY